MRVDSKRSLSLGILFLYGLLCTTLLCSLWSQNGGSEARMDVSPLDPSFLRNVDLVESHQLLSGIPFFRDWINVSESRVDPSLHRTGSRTHGLEIGILMTDNRSWMRHSGLYSVSIKEDYIPYWVTSVFINLLYAQKHGYSFWRVNAPDKYPGGVLPYHGAWHKLMLMRYLLPKYDYVFYLDSDAHFWNQDLSLFDALFSPYNLTDRDIDLVISKDPSDRVESSLNTGTMLFRNSPRCLRMLDEWILSPVGSLERYLQTHSWEQYPFNMVIYPKYKDHILVTPLNLMGIYKGEYIHHTTAIGHYERGLEHARFFTAEMIHRMVSGLPK